jgi:hypothetical protein
VDEGFPLGAAVVEGGGVEADAVCELANGVDVFELEGGTAAGGEVAAGHAVAMKVEDAAFGEATEKGLTDEGGIDAGELGEPEGPMRVSGECEERFEDAMRVNLDGGQACV